MSNEQNLPEIRFDAANLYQEDVFTDRTAGTIRRLVPVLPSGERDADARRAVQRPDAAADSGRRAAAGLRDRGRFARRSHGQVPAAVQEALEQAIEEAREMRREAQSRIVVPEAGGLGGGLGGPAAVASSSSICCSGGGRDEASARGAGRCSVACCRVAAAEARGDGLRRGGCHAPG